jgi:hypothetical protein
MSSTTERDKVSRIAKNDFSKALKLARKISEPWFKCQALADVARYAPEADVVAIAKEAINAAQAAEDNYQKVAATAWPIRALIERGHEEEAAHRLIEFLELSIRIENPVSHIDALFLLWEAFLPATGKSKELVLRTLDDSCIQTQHWKAWYLLRDTALIIASENRTEALRIGNLIPEGKYKRQALKRIEAGETMRAKEFFHQGVTSP